MMTHGFADKGTLLQPLKYTLIDDALVAHLGDVPHASALMEIWDAVGDVTLFAFRVLDEVKLHVEEAAKVGVDWKDAVDEQLLQKVLTKIKGAEQRVEKALEQFIERISEQLSPSHAKAYWMLEMAWDHGVIIYF